MSCSMTSGFTFLSFILLLLLNCFTGHATAAVVTLRSIELYKTHELLTKPTVYFQCKGENKTVLPDVKKTKVEYSFKGEESWQPLTNLNSGKCKRCGLYEQDFLKRDVFDEWELCPSDFTAPDGVYTHQTGKEFNATFVCPECLDLVADHNAPPPPSSGSVEKPGKKGLHIVIVLLICAAVISVVIVGIVGGYKYWKKRKRQQEQARFLKLFEQDDMDDDFGLEEML